MVVVKFEGIVIGFSDLGDVDRLMVFYTPDFGKLEIPAKGARYEKSKLRGHLEPLTHGEFMMARARGRGVLTDAVSRETFPRLRSRAETSYLGSAIAQMYNAYCFEHAPDTALWRTLQGTLSALNDKKNLSYDELRRVLDAFAQDFVQHLGYLNRAQLTGDSQDVARPHAMHIYDALLTHTDIAGPAFSHIAQGLEQLAGRAEIR